MQKTNPEELLAAGVHFGHKQWRIHPKSRPYIYKIERKASIIDLFQTAEHLDKARQYAYELGTQGKVLLVIASKKPARTVVSELCQKYDIHYLTNKWIGGFLTNFEEISKNIKKMIAFKKDRDGGVWGELPKHEVVKLEKGLSRIERIYKGVEGLTKVPDALFIVDIKKEKTATDESRRCDITTIALVDTNADPNLVDYPVVGNDDAGTSVQYITEKILEAYATGREDGLKETPKDEPDKPEKVAIKGDETGEKEKEKKSEKAKPKIKLKPKVTKKKTKKVQVA